MIAAGIDSPQTVARSSSSARARMRIGSPHQGLHLDGKPGIATALLPKPRRKLPKAVSGRTAIVGYLVAVGGPLGPPGQHQGGPQYFAGVVHLRNAHGVAVAHRKVGAGGIPFRFFVKPGIYSLSSRLNSTLPPCHPPTQVSARRGRQVHANVICNLK
jgi:hypothetical protein